MQLVPPNKIDVAIYVLWNGISDYYVGMTRYYPSRMKAHKRGKGHHITSAWIRKGQPVLEFWKISLPAYWMLDELSLLKLEDLVKETLTKQNPACYVY